MATKEKAAELALGRVIPAGGHVVTQYMAAGEVVADATCLLVFSGTAYANMTKMANPEWIEKEC